MSANDLDWQVIPAFFYAAFQLIAAIATPAYAFTILDSSLFYLLSAPRSLALGWGSWRVYLLSAEGNRYFICNQ